MFYCKDSITLHDAVLLFIVCKHPQMFFIIVLQRKKQTISQVYLLYEGGFSGSEANFVKAQIEFRIQIEAPEIYLKILHMASMNISITKIVNKNFKKQIRIGSEYGSCFQPDPDTVYYLFRFVIPEWLDPEPDTVNLSPDLKLMMCSSREPCLLYIYCSEQRGFQFILYRFHIPEIFSSISDIHPPASRWTISLQDILQIFLFGSPRRRKPAW